LVQGTRQDCYDLTHQVQSGQFILELSHRALMHD